MSKSKLKVKTQSTELTRHESLLISCNKPADINHITIDLKAQKQTVLAALAIIYY